MTATHRTVWLDAVARAPLDGAQLAAARAAVAGGLAAAERRRASDAVRAAIDVAAVAVAASGHDARTLASVFASAHGDLATTDALCRTLADDSARLSPTRFHQSVHNAASGYWAIASGSRSASTAVAAQDASGAAGWLEAAAQCAADAAPVLLVYSEVAAVGALASVNSNRSAFALALVVAPQRGTASRWRVDWRVDGNDAASPPAATGHDGDTADAFAAAARSDATDAAVRAFAPLADALAAGRATTLRLALGATAATAVPALELVLQPWSEGER